MMECVKCGRHNSSDVAACIMCTWPLTVEAWEHTNRFRIRRVTIDTNCINSKHKDSDLNTLENWAAQGLLVLQRANALMEELKGPLERIKKGEAFAKHPELFRLDMSILDGGDVIAGPDMGEQLRQILFPTSRTLTHNQKYDIEHLRQHIQTGGDIFITSDTDFTKNGKQVKLARFGIWVFTPADLVLLLRRLYHWS